MVGRNRVWMAVAVALVPAMVASAAEAQEQGRKNSEKHQIEELSARLAESEQRLSEQDQQIEELIAKLTEAERLLATAREAIRTARQREAELQDRLTRAEQAVKSVDVRAPEGQLEPAASERPPSTLKRIGDWARPCLKLRESPSFEATSVDCLEPATGVTVIETTGPWASIETADGRRGWVAADDLEDHTASPSEGSAADLRRQLGELQAKLAAADRDLEQAEERLASLTRDLSAAQQEAVAWHQRAEAGQTVTNKNESLVAIRQPLPIADEPTGAKASRPSPEEAPAPLADQPSIEEAAATVQAWAAAWSDQRVDDYLSFYSAGFETPPNLSRRQWEEQRRDRLSRPGYIAVVLSELRLQEVGPGRVQVTFQQGYDSDIFRDSVDKVLTVVLEDGVWKILSEQVAQ